jgi:hypothetical protein
MPKVNYGEVITQMKGKSGGHEYVQNQYGAYMRRKTAKINRPSPDKLSTAAIFSRVSSHWKTLTPEQQQRWEDTGKMFVNTDSFGMPQTLTGFNFFVECNCNRVFIGEPIIDDPININPTWQLIDYRVNTDPLGTTLELEIVDPIPNDYKVLLFTTPAQNPGLNKFAHIPKVIVSVDNTTTFPLNVTNKYYQKWNTVLKNGLVVWVSIKTIYIPLGIGFKRSELMPVYL